MSSMCRSVGAGAIGVEGQKVSVREILTVCEIRKDDRKASDGKAWSFVGRLFSEAERTSLRPQLA